jgi:ADP-ribose pyrophosphatase YjhB (NUDIX family)
MVARALFTVVSKLLLQPYFRLTRGQTLGVRGIVRDDAGAFLLVRHTYAPGWTFPGGGVDREETLEEAVTRELCEEVGVEIVGRPRLFGIFANLDKFKGDHVAVYIIDTWKSTAAPSRSLEIAEHGFFAHDSLPDATTGGARRRIGEIVDGTPPPDTW